MGLSKRAVLFKQRGKSDFYLSREEKNRKAPIYMGGVSKG
jgi:hypothetical protein